MDDHIRAWVLEQISCVLDVPVYQIRLDHKFTELGGNSLSAVRLRSACQRTNVFLSVESILGSQDIAALLNCAAFAVNGGKSSKFPIFQEPKTLVNGTSKPRSQIIDRRLDDDQLQLPDLIPAHLAEVTYENNGSTPMTEMQLALIHGTKRDSSRNVINYFETYPSDRIPAIRAAWKTVVEMEPIFRTKFDLRNGGRLVEQNQAAPFIWTEKIIEDRESYQLELHRNELSLPNPDPNSSDSCYLMVGNCFDVITLRDITAGTNVSTIAWRIHHALIDGYSAMLVLQKLRRVAAGLSVEPSPSFASLAMNLRQLQAASKHTAQAFWQEQYAKYPSANGQLLLKPPRQVSGNSTETVTFQMPSEVSSLARDSGVTIASVCYAAWALALTLYTDSNTVLFGAILSGRNLPLPNVETTVGPLVNTLPLHVNVDSSLSVKEFLQQVFNQMVKLASFQWSLPEHGYTRQFSSALSIQFDFSDLQDIKDLTAAPIEKPYSLSHTDIPVGVFVETNGTVRIEYDNAVFHQTDIETLGAHYQHAFSMLHAKAGMDECLNGLLTAEGHHMLRAIGNCGSSQTTIASVHEDLVDRFHDAVTQNPEHVAVEKGDIKMTYSELFHAANNIARRLKSYIEPGDVVCLHADRSVEWVSGIYGILIAGGVYCPTDPSLPQALRDSQYESAGAKAFLVPYKDQGTVRPACCDVLLVLEEILSQEDASNQQILERQSNPLASAYICFTSGSTGKPKGVICTHAGLVAFQRDKDVRLTSQPGCKIAQTMSVGFDGSIHEIFSTLSYGGTLVLPHSQDPFAHLAHVNVALFTPSVAKVLDPTHFPMLNTVYLVGEPVPQEINDRWASHKTLYNMYGPTEGTGGATIKQLLPNNPVSIGRPNPSTRIYIMNRNMELVPPGVTGEICLAGVQVARGYINMPVETSERFLPDLECKELGEMLYRTGDHGYWDVDTGEIICLGRRDRQIKLRGFRLDLNDLEIRMLKADSTVTAVAIAPREDYLVAMVTPSSVDTAEFASKIRNAVPVHALPKHIISIDEFPMTTAGKLDYKTIPNHVSTVAVSSVSPQQAPLIGTQSRVARLWRAILDLDPKTPINCDSDFIHLGGHSVLQLHLATKLNEEFQCRIPFKVVVESPTLQHMADNIDTLLRQSLVIQKKENNIQESHVDEHELAPIELEWWQKYQLDEGSSAFNVCFAARFDPLRVDQLLLTAAWNTVLAKHRVLRSRYIKTGRRAGVRRKYAETPPQVQRLRQLDVWKEVNRPFDLARNDPIRVIMSQDSLLVVVSHIVCDLTTLELLHDDVVALYRGTPLAAIDNNYMEVTFWNNIATACDLDFWTQNLANMPSTRTSFEASDDRIGYRGSSHIFDVPSSTFSLMLDVAAAQRMTLHQLALAAVALTMQADQKRIDIVLGGPHLNRKTSEAQKMIGLFLEPLPIRITSNISPSATIEDFLLEVKGRSQQALGRTVPWNQLLRHLGIMTDFPNHPVFDIMVTFHDNRERHILPLPGFQPLNVWAEGSKFKLMFEFVATSNEKLELRIEHDEDCYPNAAVRQISSLLLKTLGLLGAGVKEFGEVKRELAQECHEIGARHT
ncbi:hypothetical protein AJ80_05554 [Polytolypa hystricis UAMH7299]|uniref:Carrier domain-containing protein n=1 Tax=Polytolypa hystricis (strain UAMH7299) TaxID=1447883 RepID=A0A2B7Y278_POLH7|nr:hypothetical protein AJ80_05554 [Polytolypa hystricis UAMH7299]